ncbi:MAG: TldD/PmbA family protein [Erysipelotrichaceae bacterium]|nr:TldD/PmbA family protein [Erysipelotrichaceae bacterium]
MKAPFSRYLNSIYPSLEKLLRILEERYDYVSILSTDSKGLAVAISQHAKTVSNQTMTSERGNVVRVYKDGLYSEYSFNGINADKVEELAEEIMTTLDAQLEVLKAASSGIYETPVLDDEPLILYTEKEAEFLPEEMDVSGMVESFTKISDQGMTMSENIIDCMVRGQSTHINKLFLSRNRYLRQSYVYSEGMLAVVMSKEGNTRLNYSSVSGLCGPELFRDLEGKLEETIAKGEELLNAERIVPGEYDVITSPEVTGLIAHEAFGHGVEMDMFVKGRALGAEYIGKRVGSDLVTMHEGALCAKNVTSYAFDDEGTLAGDVIEIDHGILKTGICDALSAKRLGTVATGNGKRENFEHKAYTRMTNTIFDSGEDKLEDMIASIEYGYLLDGMESGMEDPKHWGIQCIIQCGREIKDGKLTGKVVAPVIMTGYVPDLLGNISMASTDREVFGSGACGKGHKEWVKVSDGGPYLKTKARLG